MADWLGENKIVLPASELQYAAYDELINQTEKIEDHQNNTFS